ncbi:MAG: hypothetical protein R2747_23830 [Pyrinomonadaceae bacterium]
MKILLAALLGSFFSGLVLAQDLAETDLQKIGKDFIPNDTQLAHQVVEGRFAESAGGATTGNIVVLYRKDMAWGGYQGLVLIPSGFEAFGKYQLPEPGSTWSSMEPIAVFFANADRDPENELLILDRCMTGVGPTGAQYFYRTRVYDWNGNGFTHLESLSERIGNLSTAKQVRSKLSDLVKKESGGAAIPVRFAPGESAATAEGKFKSYDENVFFTVRAEKDRRMIVRLIPETDGLATAGVVIAPSGANDGQPGGLIFDSVLKESGDYRIRVWQRPADHSFPAKFKVEVIVLPSYLSNPPETPAVSYQDFDFSDFNLKLEKAAAAGEKWCTMPTQVAANLAGRFDEALSRKIEMVLQPGEPTGLITVLITDDGFADDSVRGEKFKLVIRSDENGFFKVISAGRSQVCWPGRGHQDYSPEPCS